jgi:glycosyltransferase involved in cell wall biosynthesis
VTTEKEEAAWLEQENRDIEKEFNDFKKVQQVDIGCFGAIRPLKNHLEQAVAAIRFADEVGKHLRFHINSERTEQKGDEVLKNLRSLFDGTVGKHHLIEHQWMSHAKFCKVMSRMDLHMQVSFSESFNIVTADAIYQDVPVVVSTDMDWVPSMFRAHATDTNEIVHKMHLACITPTLFNQVALWLYNRKSLKTWKKYLLD